MQLSTNFNKLTLQTDFFCAEDLMYVVRKTNPNITFGGGAYGPIADGSLTSNKLVDDTFGTSNFADNYFTMAQLPTPLPSSFWTHDIGPFGYGPVVSVQTGTSFTFTGTDTASQAFGNAPAVLPDPYYLLKGSTVITDNPRFISDNRVRFDSNTAKTYLLEGPYGDITLNGAIQPKILKTPAITGQPQPLTIAGADRTASDLNANAPASNLSFQTNTLDPSGGAEPTMVFKTVQPDSGASVTNLRQPTESHRILKTGLNDVGFQSYLPQTLITEANTGDLLEMQGDGVDITTIGTGVTELNTDATDGNVVLASDPALDQFITARGRVQVPEQPIQVLKKLGAVGTGFTYYSDYCTKSGFSYVNNVISGNNTFAFETVRIAGSSTAAIRVLLRLYFQKDSAFVITNNLRIRVGIVNSGFLTATTPVESLAVMIPVGATQTIYETTLNTMVYHPFTSSNTTFFFTVVLDNNPSVLSGGIDLVDWQMQFYSPS